MKTRLGMICVCVTLVATQSAVGELVGHWPLDDGSGDVAANKVEGGADGVITNGATGGPNDGSVWVQADDFPAWGGGPRTVIGFGGQAPAETAWVRAGSIPQMTLENDFTWAFWANQDENIAASPGQFAGIVGNRYNEDGNRTDYDPRQFIKFTPQAFEWHMNGNGDDNMALSADPEKNNITPGKWEHHAVVKDGNQLTYYRNGGVFNTSEITQALDGPMPLWFGGDENADAAEQWHGRLSDVRTYDNALTQSEVGALVPEPATFAMFGIGFLALLKLRRR